MLIYRISARSVPPRPVQMRTMPPKRVPLSQRKPLHKSIEPEAKKKEALKENQPEIPKFMAEEPPLINPCPLLAHSTENIDLASRLRSYSINFGIVDALWCMLSIAAL